MKKTNDKNLYYKYMNSIPNYYQDCVWSAAGDIECNQEARNLNSDIPDIAKVNRNSQSGSKPFMQKFYGKADEDKDEPFEATVPAGMVRGRPVNNGYRNGYHVKTAQQQFKDLVGDYTSSNPRAITDASPFQVTDVGSGKEFGSMSRNGVVMGNPYEKTPYSPYKYMFPPTVNYNPCASSRTNYYTVDAKQLHQNEKRILKWNSSKPASALNDTIRKIGEPDVFDSGSDGVAIWKSKTLDSNGFGYFKRVEIRDEKIASTPGCVYVWVNLDIPKEKMSVLDISSDLSYDESKKWLRIRSNCLEACCATFAVVIMVIEGNLSPNNAKFFDVHKKYVDAATPGLKYNKKLVDRFINIIQSNC